jgi:mRNA interferase RelE/StbE
MYELFETDEFQKSLNKLQKQEAANIRKKLDFLVYPQLKKEPHFGANIKKLRGYSPETWRYRIGSYRVFYSLDEDDHLVLLLVVENRKDAYR